MDRVPELVRDGCHILCPTLVVDQNPGSKVRRHGGAECPIALALANLAVQALVYDALAVADEMEKDGISVEVIDPMTLKPLDRDTIFNSVKKTGRLIVCDEGWINCGVASEIAATVSEECFDYLDAPVTRVAAPDTPCPFSPPLEDEYIPGTDEIRDAIKRIL